MVNMNLILSNDCLISIFVLLEEYSQHKHKKLCLSHIRCIYYVRNSMFVMLDSSTVCSSCKESNLDIMTAGIVQVATVFSHTAKCQDRSHFQSTNLVWSTQFLLKCFQPGIHSVANL